MNIDILETSLLENWAAVQIDQKDYTQLDCPVCRSGEHSRLLGAVIAGSCTSLESAYCDKCEHRYFRKLPHPQWFQEYYATQWDTGKIRQQKTVMSLAKAHLKSVPLARSSFRLAAHVVRTVRHPRPYSIFKASAVGKLRAIFPLLIGVVDDDGNFFKRQVGMERVLEIGCGDGGVLEIFSKKGFQTVGTEASPYRVKIAQEKGLNVLECSVGDFKPVEPFGPFDFVYSVHVLEHILDVGAHISGLHKLMRPGGYIYIQVPYSMNEANFVHQCHTPVHCQGFSPRSLCVLLEDNGFVPLRMQVDGNIHVLARISEGDGCRFPRLEAYRNTCSPERLLDMFEGLNSERGEPLRLVWTHPHFQISRLRDGQRIFERKVHFNMEMSRVYHSMNFSVDSADGELSFPVYFRHRDAAPPVWLRMD